ncbi:MAG: alpha-amylase family glycosyl hydrolase, partial [Pseudomonadota bacterium]
LYQDHRYNRSQDETLPFIERLRSLTDQYDDRMMVGELFTNQPTKRTKTYTEGSKRLHTAYNFYFLEQQHLNQRTVEDAISPFENTPSWPAWSFSNHDVPRAVSRLLPSSSPTAAKAKCLLALLCSLRGTIFLYQGEELGLPQAQLALDDLKDPEAIRFWPENLGRDGARTPIPWDIDAPQAGFSEGKPWLPLGTDHQQLAVNGQTNDPNSVLSFARDLLSVRRHSTPIKRGDTAFTKAPNDMIMFERYSSNERVLCVYNLTEGGRETPLDLSHYGTNLTLILGENVTLSDTKLRFSGLGAAWIKVSAPS